MTLDTFTKRQIRTTVLLELNSCFSQLSWHYRDAADAEREFLQTLIGELKQCIEGKTSEPAQSSPREIESGPTDNWDTTGTPPSQR